MVAYRPPLIVPLDRIDPAAIAPEDIGAQQDVHSCTGFALASAIELQLRVREPNCATKVSPAKLYGLATQNDEFVDDRSGGSSVRGAIKGFSTAVPAGWKSHPIADPIPAGC